MTSRTLALPFALGLLASFVACNGDDGGAVGAPCNVDADCAEGLICDEHEGQASCQEAHGHEEGEDTAHASETGHGSAEDTANASESGGHESGESGHDSGSTGSGETGHATGTETGSSTGA